MAELVEGAAEVCREAGVALIGGETAELPGHLPRGRARLRRHVRRARRARRARRRLSDRGGRRRDRASPRQACTRTASRSSDACSRTRTTTATTCSRRLGSTSHDVRRLREQRTCAGSRTSPAAVFSGTSRAILPDGLRAEIDWDAWERPPVFGWLARHVDEDELRRVFNLGIGYVAVVPEPGDEHRDRPDRARVIGVLVSRGGVEPAGAPRRRPPRVGRRVEQARRVRARAGRERPASRPPSSSFDAYRGPRRARRGDGGLARVARSRARRLRRLHAPASAGVPRPLPGRVVNVHPAPLPDFPGAHPLEDVLAAGASAAAVTVHFVDEGVDTGPVIAPSRSPCSRVTRSRRCASACTRSSTGCSRRWCESCARADLRLRQDRPRALRPRTRRPRLRARLERRHSRRTRGGGPHRHAASRT